MDRMTKSMLTSRLDALNDALDLPREPYAAERDANGGLQSNDDVFLLDWAYGGVRLSRMCNGGGERDISGRGTMRECYVFIDAMLAGIALADARREGRKITPAEWVDLAHGADEVCDDDGLPRRPALPPLSSGGFFAPPPAPR